MTESFSGIVFRPCEGFDEFSDCVQLQNEVWGFSDAETVPRRVFVLATKIGGQAMGAFDPSHQKDGTGLIGFALALPGLRGGQPYLHSHMLAVQADYRNRGIGRRLKLLQREDALGRGIVRMEWTFDPLEMKNSFLNIARLGAIARRYYPDFYGVSSSSLHGTIPTDRLCAEWWMRSPRVTSALRREPVSLPRVERTIHLPREIGQWRQSIEKQECVLQIQQENRRHFEQAFADGMAVVGFHLNAQGDGVFQLGRWQEPVAHSTPFEPDPAGPNEN